ncbi:MAG TPA: hypothetical protein VFS21_30180 [Roseiflexaceae bacterium]|nr:hypothetical protein [Roseiflexaceae bacterium]
MSKPLARSASPRTFWRVGRTQLAFFEPDNGGGQQGGGQGSQQQQQDFQAQLARHQGEANRLAETLHRDLAEVRRQLSEAQGRLPAAGSVVLTAEQAAQWTAYQGLGAPDAVQQRLTEAQRTQRSLELRRVADATGYKPAVLERLAGDMAFEVRTVEGKDSIFVKDGEQQVALGDYAKQHWADFLPALQAQQPAGQAQGQGQQGQQPGTFFPAQQPAAGAQPAGDLVQQAAQRFQQQRDAAPSPFKPAQQPK